MKTKLLLKVILLLAVPLFYFLIFTGFSSKPEIPAQKTLTSTFTYINPPFTPTKDFVNYIYNMNYYGRFGQGDPNYPYSVENHINRYGDSLHFDGIHIYSGAGAYNNGASWGGSFFDNISSYQTYVTNLMNLVNSKGLKGFYGRSRIETLCYAQSVDYEIKQSSASSRVNYGFCYDSIMTGVAYGTDSGRTVLYANTTNNSAGWLCKDIYENLQHSDLFDWNWSDAFDWKIRPMMRIKQSDFSLTDHRPVVAVVVKNFKGETVDSIVIRVRNFRNGSNSYLGEYKNIFTFNNPTPDSLHILGKDTVDCLNDGWKDLRWDMEANCKVGFNVYWFDSVDVWFDKMTVQDQWAEQLLNPDPQANFDSRIIEEVDAFDNYLHAFFVDEIPYSSLPCVRYVKDKIKSVFANNRFQFVNTNYFNTLGFKNDTIFHQAMLDIVQPDLFSFDAHELLSYLPYNFRNKNISFPDHWKPANDNDYNESLQLRVFGDRTSRTDETEFEWWDPYNPTPQGSFIYQMVRNRTYADYMSPKATMLAQPQIHANLAWENSDGKYWGNREPTNEELQAQVGISIAHGADGFAWFTYQSHSWVVNNTTLSHTDVLKTYMPDSSQLAPPDSFMFIGLLDPNSPNPRKQNMYSQPKWDYISQMNQKIQNWKPTLDKINWHSGWSVHSEGANHEFISDIKSQYRYPSDYAPENLDAVKYWELGFYYPNTLLSSNPPNDRSKYFIATNRRCVPDTPSGAGDFRQLSVKFNSAQFPDFNNWKVIDVNTGNTVVTFDKSLSSVYHSLGEFLPGEAKLFKVVPVMQEGGTFVCDESFTALTSVCLGVVNNGAYNLDIGQGTIIYFGDYAKIQMNGGEFTCGYSFTQDASLVDFAGYNNQDWEGLEFNGCSLVKMNKLRIDKVKNNSPSDYVLTTVDCPNIFIYNSQFNLDSHRDSCGAISINFVTASPMEAPETNIDITGNIFTVDAVNTPVLQVMNYSYYQTPVYIRWNTFEGSGGNAIMLNNVTGGVIKDNTITNFMTSIQALATYIDIYSNTIEGANVNGNTGLNIASGCNINLNTMLNGYYIGGLNTFINTQSGSVNIYTDNSTFDINSGGNTFDVTNSNYHFDGIMSMDYYADTVPAEQNCFKIDGVEDNPYHNVVWYDDGYGSVVFDFDALNCNKIAPEDFDLISYGEIIDTLWGEFSGMGGGVSNKQSTTSISTLTNKSDSLKVLLRKRNLHAVKRIGNEIIDNYSGSTKTVDIIQPLYYSTMVTDDSNNTAINSLKIKLENLISSNPENDALILRCNYFIQKCRVILGEYSSALSGFYAIMQNYPYNWEGIVASWDYAATQLISQSGSGGGELSNLEAQKAELSILNDDPKNIKKTIDKILNDTKERTEKQIKIEEQKVIELKNDESNVKNIKQSKSLEKKVQQKKIMQEIIKPRKPETVIEHINFVNADIQKIYSANNKVSGIEDNNILIPESYKLEQNYPNPFNPITKIKFELPQESKVTIEVYDILGRKVAQLINNEVRQPGRYEVQFNGHNFASGIYFYRLVATGFIDTKRMVLIK